ncbi:MAG TPA: NAD(+) diphosphatase [Actinomycetes bacterium]|nr:NAD(+) diphosphatase [Actinomycetes bacterium]
MADQLPNRLVGPPLARSTLDRAGQLRSDPVWLAEAWSRAKVLVIDEGRALVAGDRLVFATPDGAPEGERLFMGVDPAGVPYFAVVGSLPRGRADDLARPHGIREVGHILSAFEAGLLMTAVALANWHARHHFSPTTGQPTTVTSGGWVRVDPDGAEMWPRTDPAIIVLVHDGMPGEDGVCLLGSNAAWSRGRAGDLPRFSCLAGFVEPGESAEQTLVREVAEEVGIQVTDLQYVASQPWPYPGSLMLGFHALADPDEPLNPDPSEISDARWFTRPQIRAAAAGDPDAGFAIANPSSIAHYLIMTWLHAA